MSNEPARDTDWLAQRGWGVFCHYLCPPETTAGEWNRRVDAFDVPGLAAQLKSVGAPYFFITIGQGSGHYCAPNATYDRLTGVAPGKCSRRDLVSDLHAALHPLAIELLVYVPADGSNADCEARRALGMTSHWGDRQFSWLPGAWEYGAGEQMAGFRWTTFMRNWEAICRDWSRRWGRKVRGWWVDGCYMAHRRYPENEEPNFRSLAAALRAGNPEALVAFNPGGVVPVRHYTPHEDFTAGEVPGGGLLECPGPFVDEPGGHRARFHTLAYLGKTWGRGEPRFPDALVREYTRYVIKKGGAVTWDAPISLAGLIPEPFIRQLRSLDGAARRT